MMGNELLLDMAKEGEMVKSSSINDSIISDSTDDTKLLNDDKKEESDQNSFNNKENGESVNLGSIHPA